MTPDASSTGIVGPSPTRPAFVRPATPDDQTLLAVLRERAFSHLRPTRGGAMYLERHATGPLDLQADSLDPARRVWFGGLDGAEAGYLIAAVAPLPGGGNVGVIEGLYVEPAARMCGIGEAMMAVALAWLRHNGCVGVEATALPGDRATKNFFEEHGLKARLITVYRSLADEPPDEPSDEPSEAAG